MILGRFAEAVRKQNWAMVALEILIVVVGIFIGLQVDGWNEWRKDRAAEHEYLVRLRSDTEFNVEQVKAKARSYFDRAESLARIVGHLQTGKVDEIAENDLTEAFCYWYVPEGLRLQSATWSDMTSTGGLELITDSRLRELIQVAWAENDRTNEENPKIGAFQMDLAKPINAFTDWRFDAPSRNIGVDPDAMPLRAGCLVDRTALAAHPEVASILVQLNRSQIILGNLHFSEQRALENMLAAIEQALPSK